MRVREREREREGEGGRALKKVPKFTGLIQLTETGLHFIFSNEHPNET